MCVCSCAGLGAGGLAYAIALVIGHVQHGPSTSVLSSAPTGKGGLWALGKAARWFGCGHGRGRGRRFERWLGRGRGLNAGPSSR